MLRSAFIVAAAIVLTAPAQAQTAPELIQRWSAENSTCRGVSDPKIHQPACERREAIGARLEAMGLCYGVLSYGYNSKWEICSPSKGQTVLVKNVGQMNLSTFECRAADRSSFIGRVCYEVDSETLVVLVNSTYYAYCGVELNSAMDFVSAPSMGRYFNAHYRGKKECP